MEAVARYVTALATVIGLLSERHALEKSKNRKILPTILSNIRYLARQALPLSGDWNTETRSEENSNFHWAAETTPLKKIHKARGIAHNCSDMTCTKKYALTEGPKRGGAELMWTTRSAPPLIFCLLRAWNNQKPKADEEKAPRKLCGGENQLHFFKQPPELENLCHFKGLFIWAR